jgi:hypothetical protein
MSLIDAANNYQNAPRWEEMPGKPVPSGPVAVLTEKQEQDLALKAKELLDKNPNLQQATKYDAGKVDWSILPFGALEEISKVLTFGAQKYARGNFASNGGLEYTRVINSLLRHITQFARGEDLDPETGLSHMAHAGCNVLFLLHYELNKESFGNNDDRSTQILK